jgi:hypothetical protein
LQIENAKADAGAWETLAGLHAHNIEGDKGLAARVNAKIADAESEKATACANAAAAKERLGKIECGEDVPGGFGKPIGYKDWERYLGKSLVRRSIHVAQVAAAGAVFSMQTSAPLPKRGGRPADLARIVKIQPSAVRLIYRIHEPAIPGYCIVITREARVGHLRCSESAKESVQQSLR